METIIKINDFVNGIVWGVPIMLLILGTGVYYTVRLGFIQFRHPVWLVKQTIVKAFQKKDEGPTAPGELTSFQAAMRLFLQSWVLAILQELQQPLLWEVLVHLSG